MKELGLSIGGSGTLKKLVVTLREPHNMAVIVERVKSIREEGSGFLSINGDTFVLIPISNILLIHPTL